MKAQIAAGVLLLAFASIITIAAGAGPIDADSDDADNDAIERARTLVDRGKYRRATAELRRLVDAEPRNADAWNLLGFSHRKLGELNRAFKFYRRALELDSEHLGALEYLGELYVEIGDRAQARDHLNRLRELCGETCEEYRDLASALAFSGSHQRL